MVIIAWVVAVVLSLALIPSFFSSVSYNLTGGFGGPSNTMSVKAANIVQAQFPSSTNSSDSSILVVIQGAPVYSDSLKQERACTQQHNIQGSKTLAIILENQAFTRWRLACLTRRYLKYLTRRQVYNPA